MRTAFTLVGLFLLMTAIAACGICSKKVSCPGFDDEVLEDWFPLDDIKSLSYRSAANQLKTFTFKITSTQPYTVVQQHGGCSANKQAISEQNDAPGQPTMFIDLHRAELANESSVKREVSIQLHGLRCTGTDPGNEGFRQVLNNSHGGTGMLQYHPSIQLGGKTFFNVQSIYFDTISNLPKAPVHKIYISRQNGIIAYETYRPVMLWVKE